MKSALVILAALVTLHAVAAIVEVISPVIAGSTVPGVRDRVRYVRHIQYGRAGELEASPGYQAERMKRGWMGIALEPPGVTVADTSNMDPAFKEPSDDEGFIISDFAFTEGDANLDGVRRRRSQIHQLPTKVINAVPAARVPVYEGRTQRSPKVGHMRPNLKAIQRGGI